MNAKALLFDATLCQGCGACYNACKEQNKNSKACDDPLKDHLSADTYTVIEQHHVVDANKNQSDIFTRRLCMHCIEPTCVSVCPVGAMEKTKLGPVLYDADKCIGCRYCMQACPYQVPRYEWKSVNPKVKKCIMCHDRVKNGQPTACAEACPAEATIFGDRDELIQIAKKRMAEKPEAYYPEIYGLKEAGGTSVLFLSPVSFDQLGFSPNLPKGPMPLLTNKVMEKIPTVVSVGGVFLGSMYWLTKRKNEIAKEQMKGNNNEK
ncbi:MAG: 4Fe-4S dicluster domain-containing protein [Bacteroidota bacterium]|nr:4Fe-4S dicluster domain-containing protein [Bacteroidota bacterium]